jgi:ferric-dicitrate binding protein FerR (iron transport regulator)
VRQNENHIDDLIGKYLSREASAEEIQFVEDWVAESDSNKKYFVHLKLIFARAASVKEAQQFDADAAWLKVKAKLHTPQAKTVAFTPQFNISLYWKVAASILIVFGLSYLTYQTFTPASVIEVVADSKTESDTLPDGSSVFLNKETKLAYEFDPKEKTHIVKLKGEAYFNINKKKTEDKFIIRVDELFIKDIGTSFNVKAYPESNTVEVVVEEGEVMFYTDADSGVYLKAGGKGVYDKTTKKFSVDEPEANTTAYKTKFFIFSDTNLSTVVETVNQVYDKKIKIPDNLKNCRLTASFNNEGMDEIAAVIAETFSLDLKTSGGELILEGPGCGE